MPKKPPEPMFRNGRPVDQHFDAEERFFRRVHPDNFLPNGKLKLRAIEFPTPPGISVNREKNGGRPEYVLWAMQGKKYRLFKKWKITAIKIKDIPLNVEKGKTEHSFLPSHEPEEWNYFHSEIQCHSADGEHVNPIKEISTQDQLFWREKLRDNMALMETTYTNKDKEGDTHK